MTGMVALASHATAADPRPASRRRPCRLPRPTCLAAASSDST